jgi:hypothetical protein
MAAKVMMMMMKIDAVVVVVVVTIHHWEMVMKSIGYDDDDDKNVYNSKRSTRKRSRCYCLHSYSMMATTTQLLTRKNLSLLFL